MTDGESHHGRSNAIQVPTKRIVIPIAIFLLLGVVTTVAVAWSFAAFAPAGQTVTETTPGLGTATWTNESASYNVGPTDTGPDDNRPNSVVIAFESVGRRRLTWFHRVNSLVTHRGKSPRVMLNALGTTPAGTRVFSHSVETLTDTNPFAWSSVDVQPPPPGAPSPLTSFIIEDAAGWPWPALAARSDASLFGAWDRSSSSDSIFLSADLRPTKGRSVDDYRVLPLRPLWSGLILNALLYGAVWFALFYAFGGGRRMFRRWRGRCPSCGYDLRGDFAGGCSECGWNR